MLTYPKQASRERGTAANRITTRQRGIDPATADRIYDRDEVEFLQAVDRYKREARRPFPTLCEILSVVRSLGYAKP